MNDDDFDDYVPSVLNPRSVKKSSGDFNLTQNSVRSRCSLSLKRSILNNPKKNSNKFLKENKENLGKVCNIEPKHKHLNEKRLEDEETLRFSAIEDLNSLKDDCLNSPTLLLPDFPLLKSKDNSSLKSLSSATELSYNDSISSDTVIYNYKIDDKPAYIVSFSVKNSEYVNLSTKNSNIKNISISNVKCDMNIECEVIEHSDSDQDMAAEVNSIQSYGPCPSKRSGVSVNLEIKKQKLSKTVIEEENKILILNTSDTKKLSDVIVQPINCKLLKQKIHERSKFIASTRKSFFKSYRLRNGKTVDNLKQQSIDSYFANTLKTQKASNDKILGDVIKDGVCLTNKDSAQDALRDMSRNLCITATRHDVAAQPTKATKRNDYCTSQRKVSHRSISPRMEIKESDFSHTKTTNESVGSYSPRKTVDTIQFNLPVKSRSNKTSTVTKVIPHYKIVAGTHFAVDAFSYGEIANVKHYFLTHFHSDHYSGLRKSFNKMLFCSKITADLCISRLGVGVKYIHIMNVDESIKIDGVEVTAIDANHCPGAIMLVFTLPNGKSLLHTGDFRASPIMESYPVFWNRDIHTVYLDTTYCNPRYDFPTQDESLEMALFHLRQKKSALEKAGKKFASVLIVCGTYTIGKEKFFLGMARRVGCSVWACPEKDRVLQAVEGRSFSHAPPHSCQLHVVPMRDLTHEKLRCYLDSLQGAFSEVVAFKPSGWENGKNSCTEKDSVTIHGIPYSEHSSFSEMIRFVKYLKPKQVVPTVDISGGIKAVQKYFPCPLVYKEEFQNQAKVTDYFRIQNKHQPAVT